MHVRAQLMQQGELVAAVVEEGDKKAGARGTRSAYESTQQKEEEEITRRSSSEQNFYGRSRATGTKG